MLNTIHREAPRQEGQTQSKTAQKVYTLLRQAALEIASRRGYSPKVSQISYHVPAEIVSMD